MTRLPAALVLAASLAGCASLPDAPDAAADWPEHRERLLAQTHWDVRGRIAVATPGDSFSGSMAWQQRDEALDIRFQGPLGIGGFRIRGDAGSLAVTTRDGEEVFFDDPGADLAALVGWPVPVDSARYWVVGVPDPALEARETIGTTGHLDALEQRGWTIEYAAYDEVGDLQLPRRIVMRGGGVRIRLVLHRWSWDQFSERDTNT